MRGGQRESQKDLKETKFRIKSKMKNWTNPFLRGWAITLAALKNSDEAAFIKNNNEFTIYLYTI